MATRLIIGGFDLSGFVRLAPGENFDPADNDFLQPQFSDSAVGAGDPLLSVKEGNKELVWPIHLTPTKSATYADTVDGTHLMIRDVNRALANAVGVPNAAEWRADGATTSTFFDVTFARFEPDYSARKEARLWVSGVVRIWAPTYGTLGSGAAQVLASALGTGIAVGMTPTLSALDGDAPAQILAVISSGSQSTLERGVHPQLVGLSVVPTAAQPFISPSQFLVTAPTVLQPTLAAASAAPASIAFRFQADQSDKSQFGGEYPIFQVALSPASSYAGRQRVMMIANHDRHAGALYAGYDGAGQPIGPRARASLYGWQGWGGVDLGVWNIAGDRPTAVLTVTAEEDIWAASGFLFGRALGHPTVLNQRVGGILVLPEDRTAMVLDVARSALGYDDFEIVGSGVALASQFDRSGRMWLLGPAGASKMQLVSAQGLGVVQPYPSSLPAAGVGATRFANRLDATAAEGRLEMVVDGFGMVASNGLGAGQASNCYVRLGKVLSRSVGDTTPETLYGKWAYSHFSSSYLTIERNEVMIASVAVPSFAMSVGTRETYQLMAMNYGGSQAHLGLYSLTSGLIAAVTAAREDFRFLGNPYVEIQANSAGAIVVDSVRFTALPSNPIPPAGGYVFDGVNDQVSKQTSASAFLNSLGARRRGAIPMLEPSVAERLYAFQVPLDGGRADDQVAMNVRVRERFGFAK